MRMLSLASFDRTAIGPVVSILLRQTKPILFAKPPLGLYSPAVVEIKGKAKMLARILPDISLGEAFGRTHAAPRLWHARFSRFGALCRTVKIMRRVPNCQEKCGLWLGGRRCG